MDKRLIASIRKSIEKLDAKLAANEAESFDLKNRRDKFREMLDMISPPSIPSPAVEQHDTQPEPPKTEVPAFLKKQA